MRRPLLTAIILAVCTACQTTRRVVDPRISSLSPGNAVALGFSAAKLAEISAALSGDDRYLFGRIWGASKIRLYRQMVQSMVKGIDHSVQNFA